MIDVEKEKEQLVLELQDAKQQAEEEEKKVAERDQVVEVFQQRVAELEEAAANMTAVNSEERGTQMEFKDEVGDALRQPAAYFFVHKYIYIRFSLYFIECHYFYSHMFTYILFNL